MAWPKKLSEVACIGFHRSMLPGIKRSHDAGDTKFVEGSHSMYAGSRAWRVVWNTAVFEISESYELVVSVELISGNPVDGLAQ